MEKKKSSEYDRQSFTYAGKRTTVVITPFALAVLGKWRSDSVRELLLAFSVAHGGPSEIVQALAYWSAEERFNSVGDAIEAAIWWNQGSQAPQAQKGN